MKGSISSGVLLVTALLLAGCQTISPDEAGLALNLMAYLLV